MNWTLISGRQVNKPWDGPQYDHTTENDQGIDSNSNMSMNAHII